jgi:hypothetical protein
MELITNKMEELIKNALERKLKDFFLKDLIVSKLKIHKTSQTKKTIEFEEIKIKYDNNKNIKICPEIYTSVGFDNFVLEKDNVQVDINLDMDSYYFHKKIFENEEKRKINNVYKEKIKLAIEEEFFKMTGESVIAYHPKIKHVNTSGKEIQFKQVILKDSEGNNYEIDSILKVEGSDNFHSMDLEKAKNIEIKYQVEIVKQENLTLIVKDIVKSKEKSNHKVNRGLKK